MNVLCVAQRLQAVFFLLEIKNPIIEFSIQYEVQLRESYLRDFFAENEKWLLIKIGKFIQFKGHFAQNPKIGYVP